LSADFNLQHTTFNRSVKAAAKPGVTPARGGVVVYGARRAAHSAGGRPDYPKSSLIKRPRHNPVVHNFNAGYTIINTTIDC
jgi:hypothetical protein